MTPLIKLIEFSYNVMLCGAAARLSHVICLPVRSGLSFHFIMSGTRCLRSLSVALLPHGTTTYSAARRDPTQTERSECIVFNRRIKRFFHIPVLTASLLISPAFISSAGADPVGITPELMSITVMHHDKPVEIRRNPNNFATVNPDFAKTSRPCPPFCIQPVTLATGVETIGELELIDYLKKRSDGDNRILVIDSRTATWVLKGTIPGSRHLAWTMLSPKKGATTEAIMGILRNEFDVKLKPGVDSILVDEAIISGDPGSVFDYSEAKTLVLFCNGMWCGQSPNNIRLLLKFGYPAEKLKWYRGGMQNWSNLGLTVVK